MTKLIRVNAEFEFLSMAIETLPPNDQLIAPKPDIDRVKSIIQHGVIMPIICTLYRNKVHVIDGRRRIMAVREAFHRVEEDPEFLEEFSHDNLDHIKFITVKMYKKIAPNNQAVWSIILNEQRSDNPLSFYKYIKQLQDSNHWEALAKLLRTNKSTVDKHLKLDKLIDQEKIFTAYEEGKIATSSMFDMAVLNPQQQRFLIDVLEKEGKITGTDIKQSKSARTAKELSNLPFDDLPTITNKKVKEVYLVLDINGNIEKCQTYAEASTANLAIASKERDGIWKKVG